MQQTQIRAHRCGDTAVRGVARGACRQKNAKVGFATQFGRNLARERERVGLSQEELGVRASLHRTAVSQLERGERVPRQARRP